ncbi:MAG: hypothetical protein M1833_006006 [Piccolia ochrophora]|nr:MAG: hypothetical protein M1833_006006 [Piccolia ochrophora]
MPYADLELSEMDRTHRPSESIIARSSIGADFSGDPSVRTGQLSFTALQRKERSLQQDLQRLLDAQSEGLTAGLGGSAPGDGSSDDGSLSAASHISPTRTKVIPVRQPVERRVGLKGARRGILRTMREYAEVKEAETAIVDSDLEERLSLLEQINRWMQKRAALEKEVLDIERNGEGQQVEAMKADLASTEDEIRGLESRLFTLRAKQQNLVSELSRVENSVQSKLSSYKASLSLLDSQVKKFLARPPVESNQESELLKQKSAFLSLPAKRRTLEMARDHWNEERNALRERQKDVDRELAAMEAGSKVWKEVVLDVTQFESILRQGMKRLNPPTLPVDRTTRGEARADGGVGDAESSAHQLKDILSQMDQVIPRLEEKLNTSEENDWRLLVCCIGAELEAFKEGRAMLLTALDASMMREDNTGETTNPANTEPDQIIDTHTTDYINSVHGQDPLGQHEGQNEIAERSDDEDDAPHPDLLVSRQDSD